MQQRAKPSEYSAADSRANSAAVSWDTSSEIDIEGSDSKTCASTSDGCWAGVAIHTIQLEQEALREDVNTLGAKVRGQDSQLSSLKYQFMSLQELFKTQQQRAKRLDQRIDHLHQEFTLFSARTDEATASILTAVTSHAVDDVSRWWAVAYKGIQLIIAITFLIMLLIGGYHGYTALSTTMHTSP